MSLDDFDEWVSKNKDFWELIVCSCGNGNNAHLKICLDQLNFGGVTYCASRMLCILFEITMATKEYACLEQLLQLGATVFGLDIGDVIDEYDLLYNATRNRSTCLEYLLGLSKLKRIDNASSYYSHLCVASSDGNADAVKLLLKYGANANVKCITRDTPLHCALKNYFDEQTPAASEIVRLLLMAGSSVIDLVGFFEFRDHRIAMLKLRIDAVCD